MSQPIAITGANGNLGVRLIKTLGVDQVRALVRSNRARDDLLQQFPQLEVSVVSYTDRESLAGALAGAKSIVHLVGILKENKHSSYLEAHEHSCQTLLAALPETAQHIVYLSILGSEPRHANACLASKGAAEQILLAGPVDVTVLQVPMVLGEGDYASAALRRNAEKAKVTVFRASSMEQPIYAGDVIAAITGAFKLQGKQRLQLAGPEALTRAELIQRAAAIRSNPVAVRSLPIGLGMFVAWFLEFLPNPPVTRAMLGVLDHDDVTDPAASASKLGVQLTPLDDMLKLTTT